MGSVARAIRAALHLTRDAEDLLLRVDGYAVSSRGDASVLRDGDVVHVSARDNHAHGGPWPLSPAAAVGAPAVTPDPNAATGKRPRAPHDAPPAPLSPADPDPTRDPSDDPEDAAFAATAPGTDPDSTRSRSARRKALKRARAVRQVRHPDERRDAPVREEVSDGGGEGGGGGEAEGEGEQTYRDEGEETYRGGSDGG